MKWNEYGSYKYQELPGTEGNAELVQGCKLSE